MNISDRMTWALEQNIDPTAKLVLVGLVNHYNSQTGRCDPSIARLTTITKYDRATIFRALDRLAEIVEREVHPGRRTNYLLHFDRQATPVAQNDPSHKTTRRTKRREGSHKTTGGVAQNDGSYKESNREGTGKEPGRAREAAAEPNPQPPVGSAADMFPNEPVIPKPAGRPDVTLHRRYDSQTIPDDHPTPAEDVGAWQTILPPEVIGMRSTTPQYRLVCHELKTYRAVRQFVKRYREMVVGLEGRDTPFWPDIVALAVKISTEDEQARLAAEVAVRNERRRLEREAQQEADHAR